MSLTAFSFLMAVLWCDVFIVFLTLFRRRTMLLMRFGLLPLLCLILTTLLRLFLSTELPFTKVIHSDTIYPAVQNFFRKSLFSAGNHQVSVLTIFLFVWLAVSAVLIIDFWHVWARHMKAVSAYPRETDPSVLSVMGHVISKGGERPPVQIAIAKDVMVPYIIGFLKPIIVMPDAKYTAEELEFIFTHEWQHHRNKDPWIKLLVHMVCCLMWWNPFVYLLKSQLSQTLELRCDFAVLSGLPEDRRNLYFETILQVYRSTYNEHNKQTAPACVPALIGVRADSCIRQRFVLGLNYGKIEKQRKRFAVLLCCIIIMAFFSSYLFVFQPASLPTEEDGIPIFSAFSEDSYLVDNGDGTYQFYMDGLCGTVNDISVEPFASLPIRAK